MEKEALHAEDRREERVPHLPRDLVPQLQAFAKQLDVAPGFYYLPINDQHGITVAYAAFKTVEFNGHTNLVLATVLGPEMQPRGINLVYATGKPTVWREAGENAAMQQFGIHKSADLKTELKPHQERAVERMKDPNQRGLVLVHGLGSGKTLSAIGVADALGLPSDVVVPAALQGNFKKELKIHAGAHPPKTHISSLEGVARNRGQGLHRPLLIVDEAHRTRNPTKTQEGLMMSPAEKRLLLTGSLIYNAPSDIAGPINLVAGEGTLPGRADEFNAKFLREHNYQPGFIGRLLGEKPIHRTEMNPEQRKALQSVLQKYVDYYPGSTEEFPRRTDETIRVPMSGRQTHVYDTVMNQAPAWVAQTVREGMPPSKSQAAELNAFLAGGRQASNSTRPFVRGRPYDNPKIDRAVQELDQLLATNPKAKAIVYSNYLGAGIDPYKEQLENRKIPYGEFTGAVPQQKRDQMVSDYNEGKLKALLLSRAGGEGLDLKGTRLIQLLEPHWNEEALKQVIGRGIRYKSHEGLPPEDQTVKVQRFLATRPRQGILENMHLRDPGNSVDEYLSNLAQNKEHLNDEFRQLYSRNYTEAS